MKKTGMLNSNITKVLTDLGHTDTITVGDCGLPIPEYIDKIDLAIDYGHPSLLEVLRALEKDMVVEKIVLASEIKIHNGLLLKEIEDLFPNIEIEFMTHALFKVETHTSKAFIRTGENTSYANIILQAGVYFGE